MIERKVLVNAYTHLNFGDDLFLKILFEKFPNSTYYLITDEILYKKIFKENKIIPFHYSRSIFEKKIIRKLFSKISPYYYTKKIYNKKKNDLLKIENQIDLVITIGGSIFIEKSNSKLNRFSNHKLLSEVFVSKPKFILSSNFGPFKKPSFVEYYKTIFQEYNIISFRDSYSKSLFPDLNNVKVNPDIVFLGDFKKSEIRKKSVGFSIIDFHGRDELDQLSNEYKKLIVDLINYYIKKDFIPFLFSFCKYEGDERAIEEIIELLDTENASKIQKVYYRGDIEKFMSIYSSIEIMYPTRFHGMILSLIFEHKIHPIIYSKKMLNVLKDLSYKGSCFTDLQDKNQNLENLICVENFNISKEELKSRAENHFLELNFFLNS